MIDLDLNNLAPVVVFTYRRKINDLIDSLLKNNLVKHTNLFIFSDGYKNNVDKKDVLELRKTLNEINGFKSVSIYESKINKGLANSVIEGVTKIISKYKKVIVFEDDLIISDDCLDYMNKALVYYELKQNIWSISGYTPNIEFPNEYNKDIFLSLRANSWGWATWENRWLKIDWEIKDWDDFKINKNGIIEFNRGGNDLFKMLELQMLGKIDSWAIRWCYNQYIFNSYTVYSKFSKIINIGFDEKATHNTKGFKRWEVVLNNKIVKFENVQVNNNILKSFKTIYDLKFKTRIGYIMKKYGCYKFFKSLIN